MISNFKLKREIKNQMLEGIGKTFDDSAIYSIIERARDLAGRSRGDIKFKVSIANTTEKIDKALSNRRVMKVYDDTEKKGSTMVSETSTLVWGHNIDLGLVQICTSYDEDGKPIYNKCVNKNKRIQNKAKAGLYCIMKELTRCVSVYDCNQQDIKLIEDFNVSLIFFEIVK